MTRNCKFQVTLEGDGRLWRLLTRRPWPLDWASTPHSSSLLLVSSCSKHRSPVPLQSLVVEAVKEVRLRAHGSHVRMDAQELQQSAGATLLHPDDDGLGELFAAVTIGYRDIVRRSDALRQIRQLLPHHRGRGRVVRPAPLRRRLVLLITECYFIVRIGLLAVHGPGQRVTVSVKAVEEVREEDDHGKEDGQLGLHLQVSEVERSSPFTTSHESQSWAWGHNAGNMACHRTSCSCLLI